MARIGWDDQPEEYTAWDRIRDERRAEKAVWYCKVEGCTGHTKGPSCRPPTRW